MFRYFRPQNSETNSWEPLQSQNEMLFLESGALTLEHILSIRRLGYFQTILKRDEKEVTKRIYRAQKKNPIPGDWVLLISVH